MTGNATPEDRQLALAPLDQNVDHVRGAPASHLIIEYGHYECPHSRQALHAIEQVERQLGGTMRFAFRHFPLTGIHNHALAAAAAAEAAALAGRFPPLPPQHELVEIPAANHMFTTGASASHLAPLEQLTATAATCPRHVRAFLAQRDPHKDAGHARHLPGAKRGAPARPLFTLPWACRGGVRLPGRAARVWNYAG